MDNAATRGAFNSLMFLCKHRSEDCSLNTAYGAYAGDHVHIFEWLCDMYPEVVKVDGFREQIHAPPRSRRRCWTLSDKNKLDSAMEKEDFICKEDHEAHDDMAPLSSSGSAPIAAAYGSRRLPLAAVFVVCTAHLRSNALAPTISAFIDVGVRKRWTIEHACERNDLKLLQRLVDYETASHPPLYRTYMFSRALVHAVRHNNVKMLASLCVYCPNGNASTGMTEAASLGKVHVMEWLIMHCTKVESLAVYAESAAYVGHVNVLQWLKLHDPQADQHFASSITNSVLGNQLAIVQWLHANVQEADQTQLSEADNVMSWLQGALTTGDLDMLKYLHDDLGYRFAKPMLHLNEAVASGNLAMLQWLYSHDYRGVTNSAILAAAERGFVAIVQWLITTELVVETGYDEAVIEMDCNGAFVKAAEHGHLEIVELLFGRMSSKLDFMSTLDGAVTNGHLPVVQLLFRKGAGTLGPPAQAMKTSIMSNAASHGHHEIVQWAFTSIPSQSQTRGSLANDYAHFYNVLLPVAAADGDLNTVQWLMSNLRGFAFLYKSTEEKAAARAAGNGHVAVVKWLRLHWTDGDKPMYDITFAAQNGHLELVQWMALNAYVSYDAFMTANVAANGHLAMLRCLHENVPYCVWHSGVMDAAAENNHLHVVKWLHANRKEGCTVKAMNAVTSLEMVEWLHLNRTEGCTTDAMDTAARNGNFEILLFLHANRTEGCTVLAAYHAQSSGHAVIAQWLLHEVIHQASGERFSLHMPEGADKANAHYIN